MISSSLEGRVAVVTGGASGIGAAITRMLAHDRSHVAIVGLPADRERSAQLRTSLNGVASRIEFYEADVSRFDACLAAAKRIEADYGRIDFLVNNAGITADRTVRNMTVEQWQAVLGVNLSGPFFMIKSVLEAMIAQKFGRIVNIGSVIGHTGNFGQANYASAKAGLFGLTKTVALETAKHGITVNCVAPGWIDTALVAAMPKEAVEAAIEETPEHRLGTPDEVARVVRFLLDDNSGYITGAIYNVNGGWYM